MKEYRNVYASEVARNYLRLANEARAYGCPVRAWEYLDQADLAEITANKTQKPLFENPAANTRKLQTVQ